MAISESDISILIPTFCRKDQTIRVVVSALATAAGEVIVSDNASNDGTIRALEEIADPRLRIVVQEENVGLWQNHWQVLRRARKPWVKFLHTDDILLQGGLGAFAAQADASVAVVSAIPLHQGEDGQMKAEFSLKRPRSWTSAGYLKRLLRRGNELGTPNSSLFRADTLSLDPEMWRNDTHADVIANLVAASLGNVVLLPGGPVRSLTHRAQDMKTQGVDLSFLRLTNTIKCLEEQSDPGIRRFASVFGVSEGLGFARVALGYWRRGDRISTLSVGKYLKFMASTMPAALPLTPAIVDNLRWKYTKRLELPLDEDLLDERS